MGGEEVLLEQKEKKGRLSNCLGSLIKFVVGSVIIVICGISISIVGVLVLDNAQFEIDVSPQTVTTNEGYTFTVPGDAYTDGRDTQAAEPVTLNRINIWNTTSRTQTTCTLEHAVEVRLTNVQYIDSESRYYFQLRSGTCSGWLPEDFLSTRAEAIIGDIFP